jgi:hypothetical protein
MPLLETKGAGSAQGFGLSLGAAVIPNYIEEVFSTYLYTGNGSTQTITNGIDLAGEGGLVWIKDRNSGAKGHALFDTARGVNKKLQSQSTNGEFSSPNQLTAFNSTGFDLGSAGDPNGSGTTYASWTFRKQPKFLDIVTYTGNGSGGQNIAHNLGSVPGCIIIKRTDTTANWGVVARTTGTTYAYFTSSSRGLNLSAAAGGTLDFSPAITATYFEPSYLQDTGGDLNTNGGTYVAYLFAHNAGGFGLTGTDNVISCGSYTGNGSATGPVVTLGYEPQWVMVKRATVSTGQWEIYDSMRGLTMGNDAILRPNTSGAEVTAVNRINPTSTGFQLADSDGDVNANGSTYIYIAIRRGPMKVPTSGTSVFTPSLTAGSIGSTITTGFPVDAYIGGLKPSFSHSNYVQDRLRGFPASDVSPQNAPWLTTDTSDQEFTTLFPVGYAFDNTGFKRGSQQGGLTNLLFWAFSRAPGFFDVVCYTGNSVSGTTQAHNLGVVPELRIVKSRTSADNWMVTGTFTTSGKFLNLESTDPIGNYGAAWRVDANAAVLTLGSASQVNSSGNTYVAYLFATLAGVSKVGSYTGTGTTLQINCGFTGGARFVLIKRTDSTGDWYVWDSARGIVAGNDPHLSLNTTAAEVTTDDSVDTDSTGFVVNQVAATNVNVNTATYIFLAIA